MIIGNWGLGLIFQTSDRRVLTPENLKRTTSAVWATHSRMGLKDQSEFIRPGLGQITFDIQCYLKIFVHSSFLPYHLSFPELMQVSLRPLTESLYRPSCPLSVDNIFSIIRFRS